MALEKSLEGNFGEMLSLSRNCGVAGSNTYKLLTSKKKIFTEKQNSRYSNVKLNHSF